MSQPHRTKTSPNPLLLRGKKEQMEYKHFPSRDEFTTGWVYEKVNQLGIQANRYLLTLILQSKKNILNKMQTILAASVRSIFRILLVPQDDVTADEIAYEPGKNWNQAQWNSGYIVSPRRHLIIRYPEFYSQTLPYLSSPLTRTKQ